MKKFDGPTTVQSLFLLKMSMFLILKSTLKQKLDIVQCLHYDYFDYLTVFCAVGALIRIDLIALYLSIRYILMKMVF